MGCFFLASHGLLPTHSLSLLLLLLRRMCGGSRLNSDTRDIFTSDSDLSKIGNVYYVPVGLFSIPSPPPTNTNRHTSSACLVCPVPFRFCFLFSFATCIPKRTGTWRNLFWAAKRFCNLDTFWSVPQQSIETLPPLRARTSRACFARPPLLE